MRTACGFIAEFHLLRRLTGSSGFCRRFLFRLGKELEMRRATALVHGRSLRCGAVTPTVMHMEKIA